MFAVRATTAQTRKMASSTITAFGINCTLTPSPEDSSSELMLTQILGELEKHGVTTSSARLVDLDIKPGVLTDMGDGDAWPSVRERILASDIFVVVTPTWVGQLSSVGQRVLERLDAELSEQDESGRPTLYDRVAVVGIVGNEDGAHHITSQLFQGLNDLGFTIPAQGATYWNGEAMQKTNYNELESTPDSVATTTASLASNAAHLARVLTSARYPV
jgi:multimeric flavodoxin WrbA